MVWELLTQSLLRVLESLKRQNNALFLNGDRERKFPQFEITNEKWEHTVLNRRKSRWYPKHEVRGSLLEKLQGEKGGSR